MAVNYLTPTFQQLPTALLDKYVPGISCSLANFDQQAATRSLQIGEVQDWGMKVVRCNDHDSSCDYEVNLATAKATSAAMLDHEGTLIEEFSSKGIYWMAAGLFDRLCTATLGPIDRDSTIRSLFSAIGFPINGSGGLYEYLGMGTGDAWETDRANARRVIYNIALMHEWAGSLGTGPVKPGSARGSAEVHALIAGIFDYMDSMMDDYIARTGIDDPSKLVIVQPMNGPESSRELTVNPWYPYVTPFGYFGQSKVDLKQEPFLNAWKTATGDDFYPGITAGDSTDTVDTLAFAAYEWFFGWVSEKIYGNRNASNVLLTDAIHQYREGQNEPRFAGNPASKVVTEFGIGRRFTDARSNATERPSAENSNSYYYDADDSWWIGVPTGQAWVIGYGAPGTGPTANIAANSPKETVRTALESLPGITGTDLVVEHHWNNTKPIISYYDNPAGVAMYGYHIRIGQHGATDSKSKFKRSPARLWSPTAAVTFYHHMKGGQVDRGPALREMVRDMVRLGRKMLIYHDPYDARMLRMWQDNDGSTRLVRGAANVAGTHEWFRAGNHPSATGAKSRSLHMAAPFMIDEPGSASFMPWLGREMRRLNG